MLDRHGPLDAYGPHRSGCTASLLAPPNAPEKPSTRMRRADRLLATFRYPTAKGAHRLSRRSPPTPPAAPQASMTCSGGDPAPRFLGSRGGTCLRQGLRDCEGGQRQEKGSECPHAVTTRGQRPTATVLSPPRRCPHGAQPERVGSVPAAVAVHPIVHVHPADGASNGPPVVAAHDGAASRSGRAGTGEPGWC